MKNVITLSNLLANTSRLECIEDAARQLHDCHDGLCKQLANVFREVEEAAKTKEDKQLVRDFAKREGAYYASIKSLAERIERACEFEREKIAQRAQAKTTGAKAAASEKGE